MGLALAEGKGATDSLVDGQQSGGDGADGSITLCLVTSDALKGRHFHPACAKKGRRKFHDWQAWAHETGRKTGTTCAGALTWAWETRRLTCSEAPDTLIRFDLGSVHFETPAT